MAARDVDDRQSDQEEPDLRADAEGLVLQDALRDLTRRDSQDVQAESDLEVHF